MDTAPRSHNIALWPRGDRPRERLLEQGGDKLSEAELLAVLIGTGDKRSGHNALDAAREVLARFEGLPGLLKAGVAELEEVRGLGPVKVSRILAALELGRRLVSCPPGERVRFLCSKDVHRAYGGRLATLLREVFIVVLMDSRQRRLREVRISEGGLTGAVVHPREVLGPAIREAAAGIICLHNHPSGDPTPSQDDLDLTHRIAEAGELVGIPLLDHVIIGSEGYISLADQGFLGRRRGGDAWGKAGDRRGIVRPLGIIPPSRVP